MMLSNSAIVVHTIENPCAVISLGVSWSIENKHPRPPMFKDQVKNTGKGINVWAFI